MTDVDHEFCRWIIGGLVTGMLGLAAFIYKLVMMGRKDLIDRLKDAKEMNDILRGLKR